MTDSFTIFRYLHTEIDDESNRTPEKSDLKETEVVNIKSSNQNDNFALPKGIHSYNRL
jgi:hypothetical protein